MKSLLLLISSIIFGLLLSSCSSNPPEKFSDYFYVNKDNNNIDRFTFILYLGDAGGDHGSAQGHSGVPKRSRARGAESRDDFMSISFRMEEEAFKRLEIILKEKKFCDNEVEYDSNEYTWLKYTITGFCKDDN